MYMDLNEIQELIKFVAKAGVNEVEIEQKDFKLVIKSDYLAKKKSNFKEEPTIVQQAIPMASMPSQAMPVEKPISAPAKVEAKPVVSNLSILRAPLFPESKPFQKSGALFPTGVRAPIPVITTRRELM